jgi:hypothetical protein
MPTYKLIASNELSTSTSTITFSSIPQTYTDLLLRVSSRMDGANAGIQVKPNNSGASYTTRRILKDVSARTADSITSLNWFGLQNGNWTFSNSFSHNDYYIPDYSSSGTFYKVASLNTTTTNNSTTQYMGFFGNKLNTTDAITSIVIIAEGAANFVSGSGFYLYGISNA